MFESHTNIFKKTTLLQDKIIKNIQISGYSDLPILNGIFTIIPRPAYCDRGSFIVQIHPHKGQFNLYIDGSDMFPRYYFKLENMVSEIQCWVKKNNQEPAHA